MLKENKKTIVIDFLLLLIFFTYASGKKEVEENIIEDSSNWNESFDICEKKKGTYNSYHFRFRWK